MAVSKPEKNYFQDSIPDEIMINIFKYVRFPANLAVSCKGWSIISKDCHAKRDWMIFQYGRKNILENAIRLGSTFLDIATAQAITRIVPEEDRSKEIVRAILVSKNIIKLLKEIGYLRIHEISDADNYSIIKSVLLKLFQQTRPEVKTVVRELTELTDLGFNLKSNLIDKILVDIPQHFKDEFDIREILDESFRTIKGESNHIKFHK